MSDTQNKNRRVVTIAGFVAAAMFGFGFALIPLYDVFCNAFGINGRNIAIEDGKYNPGKEAQKALQGGIDESRTVTMQFLVTRNSELELEFRPLTRELAINPGKISQVAYYVKNLTDREMVIQAIPNITPSAGTKYLAKIECFCFNKQVLKPGEAREMPLKFVVNAALPKNIPVLTLSYRFIDLQRDVRATNKQPGQKDFAG